MLAARKQIQFQAAARASASGQPIPPLPSGDTTEADHPMSGESKREGTAAAPSNSDVPQTPAVPPNSQPGGSESGPSFPRQPWEHIEELFQILKTSFPLLILGMETIVDQLTARFKASPEEEIYRLVCMLMQDCLMVSQTSLQLLHGFLSPSPSPTFRECSFPRMMGNSCLIPSRT
jgi:transformation/transcription domain-associated protein